MKQEFLKEKQYFIEVPEDFINAPDDKDIKIYCGCDVNFTLMKSGDLVGWGDKVYDLLDIPEITEVWRRGSEVASWLLDLTAQALNESEELTEYSTEVSDSGEGRWTVQAAIEAGIPAHVLSASLYSRFASRNNDEFANRVLSAMRYKFGGHNEKPQSQTKDN
jgi:6-phosphogluconate dehydrogenase (decarboxylating)